MKNFAIKYGKPTPLEEQETILTYDKEAGEWGIYTDNPVHARKWEKTVVPSDLYPSSKTYHEKSGELIGLDGRIDGSVHVRARTPLTEGQKAEAGERMRIARSQRS